MGQGREGEALHEFSRRFKQSRSRLQAVAMDMSGAYAASVLTHAILTFEHILGIKLIKVDDIRRELV